MPSVPGRFLFPFVATIAISLYAEANLFAGETTTHPVIASFERFYANPPADAAQGGGLLLGELNCVSCHKSSDASLARRQAPVLDAVASRVKVGYLRKFLSDPHATKPGTTMPQVFAGDADKARKIEALVHFLASTGALKQERPDLKGIAAGRDLYLRVGCVACHGTRDLAGKQDKLFATSVPLGDLKQKYSLASLAAFLENPHQARPAARMPGLLNAKEAKDVTNYLLQGLRVDLAATKGATTYAYYEGTWDKLPDFDKIKPIMKGICSAFDVTVARQSNNFGLKFEGYFKLERDGAYKLSTTSDDGSKVYIDGKQVVDNDGVHAPKSASGTAKLSQGVHKVTVLFFQGPGGAELDVQIAGPGLGQQSLASLVAASEKGLEKQAVKPKPVNDEDFIDIQPALADKGREIFASAGCANCHEMKVAGKTIASTRQAPDLSNLNGQGGCINSAVKPGVPWYGLSAVQRQSLVASLQNRAVPSKEPAAVIARALTTFNCYACHDRDKKGGVEEDLNKFFETSEREMGDEARIPPSLNGVGAKLNAAYMKHILANGAHDRPYMHTRMPKFGDANVGYLTDAFAAVDKLEPSPTHTFKESSGKVKADGRHMVGGNALGCIKCHTFAGYKAEGVQGIDMTLMPQRLKHDWFAHYLLNPNKFRPGTRMPTAWPGGQTLLPKVLAGDTNAQIEAIWLYLSDGKKAALPLGLKKQFIALVPQREAIIYRNFLAGAGPRAIGVGYPEKAHLAFDANAVRLAMIWQGGFIDAARHWTGRGEGFEPPLGDNVLHLASGPAFAVLQQDDDPWPTKSAKELGYTFGGYRLGAEQRPTFFYALGDIKVEDFPNAVATKDAPILRRTLTLTAPGPVAHLWFRAIVADKIERVGNDAFRVGGEWTLRFDSAEAPRIRTSAGKQELLVPLRFMDGRARIVQEFIW